MFTKSGDVKVKSPPSGSQVDPLTFTITSAIEKAGTNMISGFNPGTNAFISKGLFEAYCYAGHDSYCINYHFTCLHYTYTGESNSTRFDQMVAMSASMDVDDCESQPCLHGGTCTDGVMEFFCDCPLPYYGVTCGLGESEKD